MRAIEKRLRQLEQVAAPDEREQAAVQAILEARRRRLGPEAGLPQIPPEWFAGCSDVAEEIIRARKWRQEHCA